MVPETEISGATERFADRLCSRKAGHHISKFRYSLFYLKLFKNHYLTGIPRGSGRLALR